MNDFLKDKIKELALKHKLTQTQVLEVFYSQFKHVRNVMVGDSTKEINCKRSVKIKGLCTFEYNPFRGKKLLKLKQEKDARKNMVKSSPEDGERIGTN